MVLLMIEVCARFNSPNIFCAPAWSVTTSRNFIRNKNANCGEKHGKKTHATKQTSFTWRFVQTPFFQYAFYRHSLRLTCYQATTAKGKEYLRNFILTRQVHWYNNGSVGDKSCQLCFQTEKTKKFTWRYSAIALFAAHQAPFPFGPAVRCNRAWCGS